MVEEPTNNAARFNFKNNQAKAKSVIYDSMEDNLMSVISPLKTAKECFETLTKLYDKNDPTQKWSLNNTLLNLKMERDPSQRFQK